MVFIDLGALMNFSRLSDSLMRWDRTLVSQFLYQTIEDRWSSCLSLAYSRKKDLGGKDKQDGAATDKLG
jgi:hypothetical protein